MPTDYTKIPKELQEKMKKWEANKPEFKSVKLLEDIGIITEDISNTLVDLMKDNKISAKEVGALLLDVRESLAAIKDKDDIEVPDFAKPIVESLRTLDTSISKAISGINFKPEFKPEIKVSSPDVKVEVPEVDLSGIEKVLKGLPAAFDKAIKSIPKVEMQETDFTPLLDSFKEISDKLDSIDTATRMKPVPGSIKVNNLSDTPLITGFSTEAKQDSQITQLANILIELTKKTEATQNQQVELINAIRLVLQSIANPAYVDKSANQMRSQVTGSLTTVSTVTTVTNLTNIGSFPADHLQRMDNMTAWATSVRQIIV